MGLQFTNKNGCITIVPNLLVIKQLFRDFTQYGLQLISIPLVAKISGRIFYQNTDSFLFMNKKDALHLSQSDIINTLNTSLDGLSQNEAEKRLLQQIVGRAAKVCSEAIRGLRQEKIDEGIVEGPQWYGSAFLVTSAGEACNPPRLGLLDNLAQERTFPGACWCSK